MYFKWDHAFPKWDCMTAVLVKIAKEMPAEPAVSCGFHLETITWHGQLQKAEVLCLGHRGCVRRSGFHSPACRTCCFTSGHSPGLFGTKHVHPWGGLNLSYLLHRAVLKCILLMFMKCFEILDSKAKLFSYGVGFFHRIATTFIVMVPALQHH